jgi:hypothetical protein
MKRTLILAAAAAIGLLAAAAQAQPQEPRAVLYEEPNFGGRSYTLHGDTANFEYFGFNDRVSSINVLAGTWEFCNDAFYVGTCRTFGPGEHRILGGQDNRISSGRLVQIGKPGWGHNGGAWGASPEGWSNAGRGDVQVFDRQNFQGYLANIDRPTPDFDPLGYNDKIASIIVRRGNWEFCTDGGYRGSCRVYGPGEYPRLPQGHDDRYSSARPVNAGGRPAGVDSGGRPSIQLFDKLEFYGRSIGLTDAARNLELLGFNDRAQSMVIERGRWLLCSDANLQGECREYGPGRYPSLPAELRGRLSSAVPK